MTDRETFALGKVSPDNKRVVTDLAVFWYPCYEGVAYASEKSETGWEWHGDKIGGAGSLGAAERWWRTGDRSHLAPN